ncbi:MAG: serine/threonine-protein kinase [Methylacidiphilales bacterium]|nr:serine/threonine-protein kinase [Candidatus Methylacidiphilales bacterium]
MSDHSIPAFIGKFKIEKIIGKGGMGIVYLGYDKDIDRRVAIKTLLAEGANDGSTNAKVNFLERFKTEVKVAARVNHPNLVHILDFGYENLMPYIVMEYIEGVSLKTLLQLNRINFTQINKIFWQVLCALEAIHKAGIVHRDLKPANLIITDSLAVKVTDFGVSLDISKRTSHEDKGDHTIVGSYRYMPYEQHVGDVTDFRADIYSVTVVFLDLILNARYSNYIKTFLLSEIASIYLSFTITQNHIVPTCFRSIFEKGLSLKAANRFSTIQEFKIEYRACVEQLNKEITEIKQRSINEPRDLQVRQEYLILDMINTLQPIIGPAASALVHSLVAQETDPHKLIESIAQEIPNEKERKYFITVITNKISSDKNKIITSLDDKKDTKTGGSSNQKINKKLTEAFSLNEKSREELIRLYAQYMGPLAECILDEKLSFSKTREEFISELTSELPEHESKALIDEANARGLL